MKHSARRRRSADDAHGLGAGGAIQIDDQSEKVEVQRPDRQIEDRAGRDRRGARRGLRILGQERGAQTEDP